MFEGRGKIGDKVFREAGLELFQFVAGGGFKAGKGEVEVAATLHGDRELVDRVPVLGQF